ncbi:hypothetical protein ACFIQF_22390 [Comamonas sp. J-3]|uniref:hypothetical protein n=1 Tax=Comamonas trifloxystrobinivorans TaxID=3350256 RepID=UPI00372CA37C
MKFVHSILPPLILLSACSPIFSEMDCSENIYEKINSENGLVTLNLTKRDCGATTAVVKNVYAQKKAVSSNQSLGDKIYSIQGEEHLDILITPDSIIINSPKNAPNVFFSLDHWKDMKILYK